MESVNSSDHAIKVRSILNKMDVHPQSNPTMEIKRNESLKVISDWEKKVSSPNLNEFRLDSFIYAKPDFNRAEPSYLKLIEATNQKDEKFLSIPKIFSKASVGDLKCRLLKENAKLKDRFLSTTSLFANKTTGNVNKSDPHHGKYDSPGLDKLDIQDWINNQQKDSTDHLPPKKPSLQNIINEAVDPSGMIYMASVAAAAATSAGLASAHHKVSFRDVDDINEWRSSNLKNRSKAIKTRRKALLVRDPISGAWNDVVAHTSRVGIIGIVSDDEQQSSSATRVNDKGN